MLLGAHAEGVRNVLAVTGDPPEVGDYPGSQRRLRDRLGRADAADRAASTAARTSTAAPIDAPTSFFVGVAVNPTADDLELEATASAQKLAAGAQFAMTQIVFDLDELDRFAELLGGWPVPVLAGIFPLTSYRLALRLHNEVPGSSSRRRSRTRSSRRAPTRRRSGWRTRASWSRQARERCDGVYLVAPYRRPAAVLDLL